MKYTGKALIEQEQDRADSKFSCENPYHRDNVNVPQGPRVGTEGAHTAKRSNFLEQKTQRQPLADMVTAGFTSRDDKLEANGGDHEVPESGGIDSNSKIKRFKNSIAKYKK